MFNFEVPTIRQCSNKEIVYSEDGLKGSAFWYEEQNVMRAAIQLENGDTIIFHDGLMPFDENKPTELYGQRP